MYFVSKPNTDIINFVQAAGLTDETQCIALVDLVADFKAYGLWDKMKAIYPMVGQPGVSSSFEVNLKDPTTFRGTFYGTWSFADTGATPDGSTGYMDSGLIPSVDIASVNSTHIAAYVRTDSFSGAIMGCFNSPLAANGLYINPKFGGGTQESRNNSGNGGNAVSTDSRGFWINNRISSSQYKIFRNLTTNQTSNTNISGLCTISAYIGALNREGLSVESQNREIAFASIGDGLTDEEAANFYTAVQRFQTTLGRQV